jgi:hypothetical protein
LPHTALIDELRIRIRPRHSIDTTYPILYWILRQVWCPIRLVMLA